MADSHIGGLGAASTPLASADKLIIEQSGVAKRADLADVAGRFLLSRTVTTSSATSVSFTSISADFEDLLVVIMGRGTKTATLVDLRLRLNNDTGSTYDTETQQANNTTNANFGIAAASSAYVGNIAAASATANVADCCEILLPAYARTTFQKTGQYRATLKTGTAVGNFYNETGSIWWRSTAAITRVDVFPGANAFVDGTVVSLYGLR